MCSIRHGFGSLRERADNRTLANNGQALGQRCRVGEHHRTLFVPTKSKDRLERLISAHMLEERVRGLTSVLAVAAVPRAFHSLTGERGPLLDDGIAEVPTVEDCPEVELTQRVRSGDVPVVANCSDIGRSRIENGP